MKRIYYIIPLAIFAIYLLGPRPDYADWKESEVEIKPSQIPLTIIEDRIKHNDTIEVKPGNASRIVWADSMRRTEYVVVYLHGFSASPMEGDPVHEEFAKRYGANLYLPLLAGHGIDDKESFKDLMPRDLILSARRAVTIATALGEKVIIMSCSTGSALGTYISSYNPDLIHAHIMYSPNANMSDRRLRMLVNPWGLQVARYMNGSDYRTIPNMPESCHPYWTMTYRLEGIAAVKSLVNTTMNSDVYEEITHPIFVGYYYKNDEEKDEVISIPALKKMFKKVETPEDKKRLVAFPNGTHVLPSKLQNKDLESVRKETYKFAEEVLGMKPVNLGVLGSAE